MHTKHEIKLTTSNKKKGKKTVKHFRIKTKNSKNLFFKKKRLLFFKRKLHFYKNLKFNKAIIIRLKANNIFCTFNDILEGKTIFSCAASRYKIKITAKRLKYQATRALTFFYHDIKRKIKSRNIIIKIIAPKFLRTKIYYLCVRLFSRFKLKKINNRRNILYYIKDYKSFNGCRVTKKRRKKRRRRSYFKKN